jgi:hypothetical protein
MRSVKQSEIFCGIFATHAEGLDVIQLQSVF